MSNNDEIIYTKEKPEVDVIYSRENKTSHVKREETYKRASKKSLAGPNVQPTYNAPQFEKQKTESINMFLIGVAVTLVATGVVWAYSKIRGAVEEYQQEKRVQEYLTENLEVNKTLKDAMWYSFDEQGQPNKYGYNQNTLAKYINNSENASEFDEKLYGVYSKAGEWNADETLKIAQGMDIDTYLSQHGYVDKNGTPSRTVWEEIIEKEIDRKIESGRSK